MNGVRALLVGVAPVQDWTCTFGGDQTVIYPFMSALTLGLPQKNL